MVSCGVPACASGDSQLESYPIHEVPWCPVVSQPFPVVIPSLKVTIHGVPWCPVVSQRVPVVIPSSKVTRSMVSRVSQPQRSYFLIWGLRRHNSMRKCTFKGIRVRWGRFKWVRVRGEGARPRLAFRVGRDSLLLTEANFCW